MHKHKKRHWRIKETEIRRHLLVAGLLVFPPNAQQLVQAVAGGDSARLQVIRVLLHRTIIAIRHPFFRHQRLELFHHGRPLKRHQLIKPFRQFAAQTFQHLTAGHRDLVGLGVGPAGRPAGPCQ